MLSKETRKLKTHIMLTQIINGKILTPQGWLKDGSVLISDGKILEVTNCDLAVVGATLIDAKGMYIVPGGVEIHVHGGGGRDFMEGTEEAFRAAVATHMKHGTTSIFPTLSSSTIPMIRAAAETTEKLMAEKDSPVLGLHLEGHYFNMKMAGGQIPENIKNPDPEEYIPLLEETHCIKRWDAAPELPGAMQFGKYITFGNCCSEFCKETANSFKETTDCFRRCFFIIGHITLLNLPCRAVLIAIY